MAVSQGADGNPAIIQTAIWYLDTLLVKVKIPIDKMQLIAAACYWIAHKIHGPGILAGKLTRCSNHAFSAYSLLCAEKAVLERLVSGT
jgi:hypothetical protein